MNRNKVMVAGNATTNFEYFGNKTGVNFTMVSSRKWKDKNTGEMKEEKEFHNCVVFGQSADYLVKYARKGSLIDLEGRLKTEKWKDKEDHDRYTTKIIGSDVQIVDGWKNQNNNTAQSNNGSANNTNQSNSNLGQQVPQQSYLGMQMPAGEEANSVPEFENSASN